MKAGTRPIRNRPRQPTSPPSEALSAAAISPPPGTSAIDMLLMRPRFAAGRNSWSSGTSTAATPTTPNPTMNRRTVR